MEQVKKPTIAPAPSPETAALTPMQRFNRCINGVNAQAYLADVLKEKKDQFVTNLVAVVASSEALQTCDPMSIVYAAIAATSLGLPLNQNLGYAALVPYNDKKSGKKLCQFQIMRDGWVELCHRTGQVVTIANEPVCEGELVHKNKFTGEYLFDEDAKKSDKIIGYMAYIRLVNGYQKTVYWTVDEVNAHAQTYSKSLQQGYGLWKDNYNAMALKTVLKNLIKKYMPKSVDLQTAITKDQSVLDEKQLPEYIDAPEKKEAPDEQEQPIKQTVQEKKDAMRENLFDKPQMP